MHVSRNNISTLHNSPTPFAVAEADRPTRDCEYLPDLSLHFINMKMANTVTIDPIITIRNATTIHQL